ncbi:hypothetical protein RJ641_012870 [Dillenia turbinata]|uniref:Uncharacterized protein n=1 Tax=Dillenia turbinata TaxID=194707 RepID=A0AAN8V6W7_9MAGN
MAAINISSYGIISGINAARHSDGKSVIVLVRESSYIDAGKHTTTSKYTAGGVSPGDITARLVILEANRIRFMN